MSGIRDQRDDIRTASESLLQAYARCNSDIETACAKVEELGKKIGSPERKDAADLETQRRKLENDIVTIRAEMSKLTDQIAICKSKLDQLREQRKLLEREQRIKDELSLRATLAEETCKALRTIYEEFTNEMRLKITAEANILLSKLLDKEGRETLRQIVIDDD